MNIQNSDASKESNTNDILKKLWFKNYIFLNIENRVIFN